MQLSNQLEWININTATVNTDEFFANWKHVPRELLDYALDEDERAFVETVTDAGVQGMTLVFNVIDRDKIEGHYETVPITFYLTDNQLLTFSNQRNHYIIEQLESLVNSSDITSGKQLLFMVLTMISKQYFPIITQIERETNQLNRQLRQETSKEKLLKMSDLETGLVYLLSAANQNALLLEQLKENPNNRYYQTAIEEEELVDALIEARQLVNMAQLNSQILSQLSGTFNNVLNNNLNDNLTRLNIFSINLAILSLVTGFFGMNIPIPFTHSRIAWIVIMVVFWLICVILAEQLKRFFGIKR